MFVNDHQKNEDLTLFIFLNVKEIRRRKERDWYEEDNGEVESAGGMKIKKFLLFVF
jgi:hypothetical protein